MNAGKIGTLLIYDVNPVYDDPDAKNFKTGLAKVKTTISFSGGWMKRPNSANSFCLHPISSNAGAMRNPEPDIFP